MTRKSYHHGNLRETLIDQAAEMLAELGGPLGFSLADAARAAGVSAAAPYRHFQNKDELIVAVAERGFKQFYQDLHAARMHENNPFEQLITMGAAYLDFARGNAGEYIAMFESRVAFETMPKLAHLAEASINELRDVARDLVNVLPPDNRPPATMVANHLWAMSHGVVELFMRDNQGKMSPFEANNLLEAGSRLYLKGVLQSAKE